MPMQPDDLAKLLAEPHLAHWATVAPDGTPRVRPLWFYYADRALWFTTRLESRGTGREIEGGKPVAVSIASEDRPYRAALLLGTPEVWTEDRDLWLERIATKYGEEAGRRWLQHALVEPDRVAMRLVPDTVLAWNYGKGDKTDGDHRVDLP